MKFFISYLNQIDEESLTKLVKGNFILFFFNFYFYFYFFLIGRYLRIFQLTSKLKTLYSMNDWSGVKKKTLRRECRASKFNGCIHLSNL